MSGEIIKADKVLNIGQRVEFYLENDDTRYTSRIEDITQVSLVVALPVDEKRRPIIPREGERLYGKAVTKTCAYRFFTVFKTKAAEPIPVWHIVKPVTVERYQNREFVRVRVNLPVRVQLVDAEGTLGPVMESRTVDLSGNGICFVSNELVHVGTKAALGLDNLPGIGNLEIMANIAQCRQAPVDGLRRYHVGARFLNFERGQQNKLIRFIFDIERKNLAKGLEDAK